MTTVMTMTTLGQALLALLATYLVHSTVLLGAAWLLGRFLLRGDVWRETLWKAGLVGGLATSLMAQVVPWTSVRVTLPRIAQVSVLGSPRVGAADSGEAPADARATEPLATRDDSGTAAEAGSDAATAGADAGTVAANEAGANRSGTSTLLGGTVPPADGGTLGDVPARPAWPELVLLAWAAVAALLLTRLLGRRWRLARLLRGRRRITEGRLPPMLAELRRAAGLWCPIRLTSTPAVSSPLVLGRGEICVPERFLSELGPEEQRAALAHELAHLARKDPAWLLFAMLMERVFFFQPLHRVARHRLRETAEYLADSWAVRLSGGRLHLARCLAEVAAWVTPADEPKLAETLAMTEGGSPLLGRVRRLLESEAQPEPGPWVRGGAAVLLIAAAAALAPAVRAQNASATPADPTPVRPDLVRSTTGAGSEESDGEAGPPRSTAATGSTSRPEDPPDVHGADAPEPTTTEASALQQVTVVRAPADGDLTTRMAWAAEQAAARGTGSYWIAWAAAGALPMETHVSVDSRSGMSIHVMDEPYLELRSMGGGGPAAGALGVLDEIGYGEDGYDLLVLARLGSPGGDVERLAARSPMMPLRLEGSVYWLGRTADDESLLWHERLFETAPYARVGETALEIAALHAGPEAASFLRGLATTQDARREVREEAVEGLAFHPDDQSLDLLVRLAEADPDRVLRTEAVETLGELRHPAAPEALRGFMRTGSAEVRAEALESLTEQVADTALVSLLLQVALNDPEPDLRREAVELLSELPSAEAVPALRRVASDSSDPVVLREVADQLGEVGTTEALEALDGIVSTSPDREVVLEAVEAIADGFPADVARPRLEAISRDHPSVEVRREALEELMDLHVAEGSGDVLLAMALGDQDPDLRRDAVEGIADLPAADAVPLLRRVALESGDDTAERQAAESLGDVGTTEALAVLDEIIERDLGDDVSAQAVEAIAEGFARELALPRLRRILTEHRSIQVRREALDRLADLGG